MYGPKVVARINCTTSATVAKGPEVVMTKRTIAEKLTNLTKLPRSVKKHLKNTEKAFPSSNLIRKIPRNTKKGPEIPRNHKNTSVFIKNKSGINLKNRKNSSENKE